jgi:hypothetical protein
MEREKKLYVFLTIAPDERQMSHSCFGHLNLWERPLQNLPDKTMGKPQGQAGCDAEEKYSYPCQESNPSLPAKLTTELSKF